jgi:hypothetical protein
VKKSTDIDQQDRARQPSHQAQYVQLLNRSYRRSLFDRFSGSTSPVFPVRSAEAKSGTALRLRPKPAVDRFWRMHNPQPFL